MSDRDYTVCVNCGSYLKDSPDYKTMYCPKCYTKYDREKISERIHEQLDKEEKIRNEMPHWERSFLQNDWRQHEDKVKAYHCPSCSAKLICDMNTVATSCPYCGNHAILEDRLSGAFKPDYVLPFKFGKEDAVKALKEYFADWSMTPEGFADEKSLQEMKGVYVPFWIFDGKASANQYYYCRKFQKEEAGSPVQSRNEYFHAYRSGEMDFDRIVMDASDKMPDSYMDCIKPYDLSELEPFSGACMSGYYAEKFDAEMPDMVYEVEEAYKKVLLDEMRKTVSEYDAAELKDEHITIGKGNIYYVMLPVWLAHIQWNGKSYMFAINGQTGKVTGKVPASRKKMALRFLSRALPALALCAVALYFLRNMSADYLPWAWLMSLLLSSGVGYLACSREDIRMDLINFSSPFVEPVAPKGLQLTEKIDDYDRCIESSRPK